MGRLVLASRSPRRAELLRRAGYSFVIRPADVPEVLRAGEAPAAAAERLAREKAARVAAGCRTGRVLAADTIVVAGRKVLGKPADGADARRMLSRLSGREHRVVTGVALCSAGGKVLASGQSITCVRFGRLSREAIAWYVATGEPMDKAGAYGIQGRAALFVTSIRGSYSNVVGLPIELVYRMLGLPD